MTTSVIAIPGNTASQGLDLRTSFALFSIAPHSGFGGCTPNPRKEREDDVRTLGEVDHLQAKGRDLNKILISLLSEETNPEDTLILDSQLAEL